MSSMKVPFVDLYHLHRPLEKQFQAVLKKTLKTSSFVAGAETAKFEAEFAEYSGGKHALFLNSGTSALQAIFFALDLPVGSEVIMPVNTFIATAEGPMSVGLKVKFVDVDPVTMLMDLEQTVKAVTAKTSAIIPVHLYGQLVDVPKLQKMLKAAGKKVVIVEDACQSHGAKRGTHPQVWGKAAAYSFYPGKNLGALGEAGAVVTDNRALDTRARLYRSHGSEIKYFHDLVGLNLRAGEMEAAFLRVKLPKLTQYNKRRQQAAKWYEAGLKDIQAIRFQPAVTDGSHVYHLYVIRAPQREALIKHLNAQGVETGIHYPVPLHQQKAFASLGYKKGAFPEAETAAREIVSLPMHALITKKEVEYVCKVIRAFYH